ncbi:MAG: Stp1/IreP family PP2C-type Ser/Thr phosphatase [Deltaproteobacteria bacterium]|nr:Stp1/IreP family PP2C-type Ser/Thr phosphatase [Deltaproteobacteria bacterium]
MSEAKNGESEAKAPSATTLTEAVVAALAGREGEAPTKPPEDDSPVLSAVSIGPAVAVGAAKTEDPELSVSPATEADVATEASPPASSEVAPAPSAESAPASEPASEPAKEPVAEAKPEAEVTKPAVEAPNGVNDELTAPRGLPVNRDVPSGVAIKYFGRTDVGLVREHNEDNFLVVDVSLSKRGIGEAPIDAMLGDRGLVLAVCDGMGGAAAGEVASQMAVDTIHEMMTSAGPPKDRDHFARRLVRAVEEAGSRIFSSAKLDRSRRGMGTTSTVAGLVDSTLFVGQVGDSRAYVLRGDQFALITKDQSLVNQLIEAGQLTEEEAEAFEHSNIILQALGTTEEVTVDLTFLELRRGDRLLLCSDGLSGLVHADMMKDVLRASRDLVDASNQLIAMANAGGGHDNITVIVAEFDGQALKEPDGAAKVAYQQYPLPPATPDNTDPPPPRPTSVKPGAMKPGADVKSPPSLPPDAVGGGLGRWWVVAVLVLLVLALLGAIMLSMEPASADGASATRTTLSRTTIPTSATPPAAPGVAAAPAMATANGFLRFDDTFAGAALEIDGVPQGTIVGTSMVLEVSAGEHQVSVLRDGAVVARTDVTVAEGHHAFVAFPGADALAVGREPPPAPVGVEPPADMAPLPSDRGASARETGGRDREAGDEGRVASADEEEARERFVRRSGDLPHEPPPRPAAP